MTAQLVGGRYEIIRKIAEGGMGAVFEARHHMTKKTVALKVLFAHIGRNDASRQRFLREVSAPAEIGHEGIVEVYDSGIDTQDGSLFVAMEMLQGDTVREWLEGDKRSVGDVLHLFEQILAPLAAAHERGIVHRDLKPENIFLHRKKDGSVVVKILDFGIARDLDTSQENVTHTGVAMGTPHYMAPEQAMSAKGVLASADVWALGAMLYEALTGQTPFQGETASAIVVHACTQPHPPIGSVVPQLPPDLAALVDRCLSKEPTARPHNAGEMLQLLRALSGAGEVSTMLVRDNASAASNVSQGFSTGQPSSGSYNTGPGLGQPTAQGGPATAPAVGHPTGPATPAGFGTAPATAPGAPQGGFHTPAPGQGGFGTPPPSQGYAGPGATPQPGSFGAAPPSPFQGQMPSSSGGSSKGLFIGLGVVGLLVVVGGIAGAAMLFGGSDSSGSTTTTTVSAGPSGPGMVQINTNIAGGGELLVDGQSQGPAAQGTQVQLAEGTHVLELRVAGNTVSIGRVAPTPTQVTPITLNRGELAGAQQSVENGRLQAGDRTLESGELADYYPRTFSAGSHVFIEVLSSEFDTYVIAKGPGGVQHDNDDLISGDTNAGVFFTVNQAGPWEIVATSYQAGESGAYQLKINVLSN